MSNKPELDAALNAAAMWDLRRKGNRAGAGASDRAAAPATAGRT